MKILNQIILIVLISLLLPFTLLFVYSSYSLNQENQNFVKKTLLRKINLTRLGIDSIEKDLLISVKSRLIYHPNPKGFLSTHHFSDVFYGTNLTDLPQNIQKQLKNRLSVSDHFLNNNQIVFDVYMPVINPITKQAEQYYHVSEFLDENEVNHFLEIGQDEIFAVYQISKDFLIPVMGNTFDAYGQRAFPVFSSTDIPTNSTKKEPYKILKNFSYEKKDYTVLLMPFPGISKQGMLVIGVNTSKAKKIYGWVSRQFLLYLLLAGLFSLLSAFLISSMFLKPIGEISLFSQSVTSGNLNSLLSISRKDEIGMLSNNINFMVMKLKENIEKEAATAETLKKEVEQRTIDLQLTLENLRGQERVLEQDMKLAEIIQKKIITLTEPNPDLFHFDTYYQPLFRVGGDFYQLTELSPSHYRLFLADATGHGVQAALMTTIIKSEYDKLKYTSLSPAKILAQLNKEFIQTYQKLVAFFSAIVADFDFDNETFFFASSGHPDQFLYRKNRLITLRSTGKITGVIEDSEYRQIHHTLNPNDLLIFFTDGLFEEFNMQNEELGDERLKAILLEEIHQTSHTSLSTLSHNIRNRVDMFRGANPVNDDVTLILIHIKDFPFINMSVLDF